MGRAIVRAASDSDTCCILAGVDVNAEAMAGGEFPVYGNIEEFPGNADVIVDFSHHTATESLLSYARRTKTPLVIATTGHTEEELAEIHTAATEVAIFRSGNMSIGINLLMELCRTAAETLGVEFDVEIVERHHNRKLDAPSGTALMLADAVAETREESEYVYDRHSVRRQRSQKEIGIHSVRGGSIVGEHEVLFAGENEMISLTHTATSREVFATGALRAAEYMKGKSAGLYNMSDLIARKA